MSKRKLKYGRISRDEAVHRADRMAELILRDIRLAIRVRSAFEAANELVGRSVEQELDGTFCYNHAVAPSLLIHLATVLARLYDTGTAHKPVNQRDVGSIPLFVHLLQQRRVRKVLLSRAAKWTPQFPEFSEAQQAACSRSIDQSVERYKQFRRSAKNRKKLDTLKDVRNKEIAHSLMRNIEHRSTVDDLRYLYMVALDFSESALFGVSGHNHELKRYEEIQFENAKDFWAPIFEGQG